MVVPSIVSTDSGWNCTPANPGPRTAWTSPLTASRLTSIRCIASSAATWSSHRAVYEL